MYEFSEKWMQLSAMIIFFFLLIVVSFLSDYTRMLSLDSPEKHSNDIHPSF